MKWQEYQEAVGKLYTRLATQGKLLQKIYRPDRVTGKRRQIDTWWEIELSGHDVYVLIDAKRKKKINVKDVEEVWSLGNAVGAHKCVVVAPRGWTKPAEKKARFLGMDLHLFSIQDALRVLDIKYWLFCPVCDSDCIIMDQVGSGIAFDGHVPFWVAGRCRECATVAVHCGDCDRQLILPIASKSKCNCTYEYHNKEGRVLFRYNQTDNVWFGSAELKI